MQIECRDEKNIYCYLMEDDLRSFNTSLDNLTYGSVSFRKIIAMVIKRANEQNSFKFKHHDLPLQIEAIPLESNELFLQISTVDEADELDPRFAQFSPSIFDDLYEENDEDDESLENDVDFYEEEPVVRKPESFESLLKDSFKDVRKPQTHKSVYVFNSYENMIHAFCSCGLADDFKHIKSALYYYPQGKKYYLIITGHQNTPAMRPLLASLCEYSELTPFSSGFQAWLTEHCKCLMRSNAIFKIISSLDSKED